VISVEEALARLERAAVVTPSAFSLPLLICAWRVLTVENSIDTSPPSTAEIAGGPPLYGTWTISMPVIDLSSSPHSWCVLPLPAEA